MSNRIFGFLIVQLVLFTFKASFAVAQKQIETKVKVGSSLNLKTLEFKCIAKMPTTSFLSSVEGQDLLVRIVHHNGLGYAPIHEGVVVINDVPLLKGKFEQLQKLNSDYTLRFPLGNCKVFGSGQIRCIRGKSLMIEGKEVEPLSFSTGRTIEYVGGAQYESQKINLSLWFESFVPVIDVVMNYQPGECNWNEQQR